MSEIYYTPLGEQVTPDDLEEQERVICPGCGFAILEDEMSPEESKCIYCINESEGW